MTRTYKPKDNTNRPINGRIEQVVMKLFNSNVTNAAKALGVSQTSLSRALGKGQLPGYRLMLGLAKHGVDLMWVLGLKKTCVVTTVIVVELEDGEDG